MNRGGDSAQVHLYREKDRQCVRGRVSASEWRGRQCMREVSEWRGQCVRGRVSGSEWRESVSAREGERE